MTHPGQEDHDSRLSVPVILLVLGTLMGAVLWYAPGYVSGNEPLGFDSSSHILASAAGARAWQADAPGYWVPGLNLGFPLGHFYQPLPHAATGALSLLLGGPAEATRAFKYLVSLLLMLLPLTGFLGFRRLGLSPVGAVAGALALTTIVVPMKYFGLTPRHYLNAGLYTLLWGGVLAPLALAAGVRFIRGQGRRSSAVILYTLLFLCHGLLGIAFVPLYVFTACALPGTEDGGFRMRFLRLTQLGGFAGVGILFWLLPQLMCAEHFGGWPFGDPDRVNGYGLAVVLDRWLQGRFTDLDRLPITTWLSVLGLGAALLTWRTRKSGRLILFGTLLFIFFSAGRTTFGPLVDWVYPPNARIEIGRYVGVLHLFLALSAGFGVDALQRALERHVPRAALLGSLLPLLMLPAMFPSYRDTLENGMRTLSEEGDRSALLSFSEALTRETDPGRVYTGEALGIKGPLLGIHTGVLGDKPMSLSFGVGLQDSLNFYYLAGFDATDQERAAAIARLFNLRYLIHTVGREPSNLPLQRLKTRGRRQLQRIEGDFGYFRTIGPPETVADNDPILLRGRFVDWMGHGAGEGNAFLRLADPIGLRWPHLPGATSDYRERQSPDSMDPGTEQLTPESLPNEHWGEVLSEEVTEARYTARVRGDQDESWLLLKVTAHPFWSAEVDGTEIPIYHLSPSLMGIALGKGEHEVTFTFRNPVWQKGLLLLTLAMFLGLTLHDFRNQQGSPASPTS